MFKPVIYNLSESQKGFAQCRYYNKLIESKPIGAGMTLAHKLQAQSKWREDCQIALDDAKTALNCK